MSQIKSIMDINTIKSILRENKLWTNKSLGQNFLVSEKALGKIVEAANLSKDDFVLEIGPGLGVLTDELARHAKLVLAVEKDYKLAEFLRKRFKSYKNVKIIHEDILRFSLISDRLPSIESSIVKGSLIEQRKTKNVADSVRQKTKNEAYKIVSNLPYNITSPVIKKFLEEDNRPTEMILMVQKEVAERLTAKPGSSDRGILTVMIEFYGKAEIIDMVNRNCFWPVPEVDSAIIKIVTKSYEKLQIVAKSCNLEKQPIETIGNHLQPFVTSFMRLVKIGFSQKRRQIHHPLASGLHLSKPEILDILKLAKIDPAKRAEDLNLDDWINLYEHYQKFLV